MPNDGPVEVTPELVVEGLGAFDELEELGRGTYGTTFRAVRGADAFALKVIHYPNLPEYLWDREIASLQKVEHPNVVGFRDSGEFEGQGKRFSYLECEYIDGGTVDAAIKGNRRPSTEDEARGLLSGLLAGVDEIHDLGIIHRDIKPENVALRDGSWSRPVLLDFGLARVMDMSQHTIYPQAVGTILYMSPEQLRSEPARTRSDLFSLAVVAYEAQMGEHPFKRPGASSVQSMYDQISSGPIQGFDSLSKVWPADVVEVVLRLLSYHQHERLSASRAIQDLSGGD